MPWSTKDVEEHKQGLSQDQKVRWVRIANSVLEDTQDEGQAIRVANSRVGA